MTMATILCRDNKFKVLYRWIGDPAVFDDIDSAIDFCKKNHFAYSIR
jgi:hypothetical protein